jgi:hypothetical protein
VDFGLRHINTERTFSIAKSQNPKRNALGRRVETGLTIGLSIDIILGKATCNESERPLFILAFKLTI